MSSRHLVLFFLLAWIWGASFLYMRIAAPAFGAVVLVELRLVIGIAVLLPVLLWRDGWRGLNQPAAPMVVMGISNAVIPYTLFAWASLSMDSGLVAVLNSTAALWTALIAALWFKDRITPLGFAGLLSGIAGVWVLSGSSGTLPLSGIAATMVATFSYAFAANYMRARIHGTSPLALSVCCLGYGAIVLAPFAILQWPTASISAAAWWSAAALGGLSTGLALIIYYQLIREIGGARAIMVTYLIPVVGVILGALVLDEPLTGLMLAGAAMIIGGTVMASRGLDRRTGQT